MREQLDMRLAELQREFAAGEQQLRELEAQQVRLRDTMLRIDGAMHVLREMLAKVSVGDQQSPGPGEHVVSEPSGNGRSASRGTVMPGA